MKKTDLYTLVFPLFLLIAFIISCSTQEKSSLPQDNQLSNSPISILAADSDAQIAEYIRHIFQDKNGDLWFGTNDYGAVHFNGNTLSYFSNEQGFSGSQITGITEDKDRNIWFATDQGIVKYDWSSAKNGDKLFTNYTDAEVFKGHQWSIFSDSKGNIWVGTSIGVLRYDGTTFESFQLPYSEKEERGGFITNTTIWSISEDKKGNIWFGTNGNGAFKYNGDTFTQFTEKDGLTDNSVDKILEDKNGNIWFGTRHGGLSHYNGKTFTNYTENDSIGNNEVCSLYEDVAGNIWFSSEGFGVYRYDGKSFINYSLNQGLGVKAVQTIFEDKEGHLWVGGGGGLYRYDGDSFLNVTRNGPWK